MAIDTRQRRAALSSIGLPWIGAAVTPGTQDAAWRQTVGYSYPGIAADAPSTGGSGIAQWQGALIYAAIRLLAFFVG
jgi:hypothetical protein